MSSRVTATELAYDDRGSGVPLILLHGLTFDRTTWTPIIEHLGDDVRTLAIDLPGHGESGARPSTVWEVARLVHELAAQLGIERPVVVGHSISGAIASIYAATYPTLGVVNVDQPVDVRPFAQLVRRMEPGLRRADFAVAFDPFQQSLGLELLPEPLRSHVATSQRIHRDTVITIANLQIEEWPGYGHFVHLATSSASPSGCAPSSSKCARAMPSRPSRPRTFRHFEDAAR